MFPKRTDHPRYIQAFTTFGSPLKEWGGRREAGRGGWRADGGTGGRWWGVDGCEVGGEGVSVRVGSGGNQKRLRNAGLAFGSAAPKWLNMASILDVLINTCPNHCCGLFWRKRMKPLVPNPFGHFRLQRCQNHVMKHISMRLL